MPNTEVKLLSADCSEGLPLVRVGRRHAKAKDELEIVHLFYFIKLKNGFNCSGHFQWRSLWCKSFDYFAISINQNLVKFHFIALVTVPGASFLR